MTTSAEKMVSGALYNASDPELAGSAEERASCSGRQRLTRRRAGRAPADPRCAVRGGGKEVTIEPPFFCDYGGNIRLGDRVFFNFNCVILDRHDAATSCRAACSLQGTATRSTLRERRRLPGGSPAGSWRRGPLSAVSRITDRLPVPMTHRPAAPDRTPRQRIAAPPQTSPSPGCSRRPLERESARAR